MKLFVIIFISIIFIPSATAASSDDINKLTTYSVILGRATACGINTKTAFSKVGYWMNNAFPSGSTDQMTYMSIFMQGAQNSAEQQASGNSPDTCASVTRAFNSMVWP